MRNECDKEVKTGYIFNPVFFFVFSDVFMNIFIPIILKGAFKRYVRL